MTSLISGHKTQRLESLRARDKTPRAVSDFFAKARKVFNKGHGEIISKDGNNLPPYMFTLLLHSFTVKADLNTHTHTHMHTKRKQQPKRRGKKKKRSLKF